MSFSGNNETVLKGNNANDTVLYFRGWRILNGVFQDLAANYNWGRATDVLISGCSAVKTCIQYIHRQNATCTCNKS